MRSENPLIAPVVVDDEHGRRTNVRIRHSAVRVKGDTLYLFYTRKEDAPERILLARVPLERRWTHWQAEKPVEVMRPETDYEGTVYPIAPSRKGGATQVQQLRDPYVFEDQGRLYLFYAVAGEMGIAVAEITIRDDSNQNGGVHPHFRVLTVRSVRRSGELSSNESNDD